MRKLPTQMALAERLIRARSKESVQRGRSPGAFVILKSSLGLLPTGRLGVVDIDIPEGLTPEQTEMFLREHAAEICGFRGAQSGRDAASV